MVRVLFSGRCQVTAVCMIHTHGVASPALTLHLPRQLSPSPLCNCCTNMQPVWCISGSCVLETGRERLCRVEGGAERAGGGQGQDVGQQRLYLGWRGCHSGKRPRHGSLRTRRPLRCPHLHVVHAAVHLFARGSRLKRSRLRSIQMGVTSSSFWTTGGKYWSNYSQRQQPEPGGCRLLLRHGKQERLLGKSLLRWGGFRVRCGLTEVCKVQTRLLGFIFSLSCDSSFRFPAANILT